MAAESVTHILKARLEAAGISPEGDSGHSLRAGYATSALQQGVPIWQVRRQTGHASLGMVDRYNRDRLLPLTAPGT